MDQPLRVALLTVGDPGRMTGGYLFHRRLAAAAPRHGASITFVSIPAGPLAWQVVTGPHWRRDRAIRDADVIVLDSIAAAPAAPWVAGLTRPLVAILHQPPGGFGRRAPVRALLARLDRRAYRACVRLLAASDWLAEDLARQGFPPGMIRVLPPGKDVAGLAGPAAGGQAAVVGLDRASLRDGRRAAALCVASWLPSKGILELLEAVGRLAPDRLTLHLAGDPGASPGYGRRVRARLAGPDLRDRVRVHGVRPPAAIGRLYAATDLFALPSYEETYGTAWGEAMAAGLPVVGWRAGNLPYLADDGREALMSDPGDVAALAADLERLATDEELRDSMGHAAAARARMRPTWAQTAEAFFGALRDILATAPRGDHAASAAEESPTGPSSTAGPASPAGPTTIAPQGSNAARRSSTVAPQEAGAG